MPVRFQRENNPWFPLPPDYPDLDKGGQKKARLNALMLQETPEDVVAGWDFFRRHYLCAVPDDDRLPEGFFYKDRIPSPPPHYAWIHAIAKYQLNTLAAPRYSAKSVVLGTELPLYEILTSPYFKVMLVLSKDEFVEERMERFMYQIEENPIILEDFGVLKPSRGAGSWNKHHIILNNRAEIRGVSIEGKMRGQHPDHLIFDDVEQDLIQIANIDKFLARMENILFVVARPMIGKTGKFTFVGTLDHLRSFLYYFATSKDPRLTAWNRMVYRARSEDGELFWPQKWDEEELVRLKAELGNYAFNSQLMNDPRSEGTQILNFNESNHTYWFDGEDPASTADPLNVRTNLVHNMDVKTGDGERINEEKVIEWVDYVREMRRFITVDYAPTQESYSDYSVVHVMGQTPPDILWSLDLFVRKMQDTVLIEKIWEMALRWKVNVVGVEAVGVQEGLVNRIKHDFKELSEAAGWYPRVIPIKYPAGMSKEARMMGLEWRFSQSRIKLPKARLMDKNYKHLYGQIMDFTGRKGDLQHDDALDTLAMSSQILRGTLNEGPPVPVAENDVIAQMSRGQLFDPSVRGMPLAGAIPSQYLPVELVNELYKRKHKATIATARDRRRDRDKNRGR